MKKINKLLLLGFALVLAWSSCRKEETIVNINPNAVLTASISAPNVVLLKDNKDKDAFTVSWTAPDFGFAAAPSYTVYLDKKGNNFAKQKAVGAGSALKRTFKTSELNDIIKGFGLVSGTAGDLEVKVECLLGAATVLTSTVSSLKATAYDDVVNLTTTWGVVGSATANGWDGPDQPAFKLNGTTDTLVAFVTLTDGAIKFRENNKWDSNLGSAGATNPDPAQTGALLASGKDIAVKKGTYRVLFNPTKLTYKIEPYSWGVVGEATANGWNGPDQPLAYDGATGTWKGVVSFIDGPMKFRLNNAWDENFGAEGTVEPLPIAAAGKLVAGGKNFGVKKGLYLITLDLNAKTYTFVPFVPWGLVGDATPNGWNGPDIKFTEVSPKKWVLNNVVLITNSIKFRENDAWTNNVGATGTVEPLPAVSGATTVGAAGGKNIGVTAGTWSFELDLTDAANPKYKATKK